ncbi:ImmA/IrrE family metallo-endopeptidase [Romeria aff. gracilis LEGE 07310]|uniref:ImmA/IrrE family metallo-endopeptidase n=1 Tax=Vasconcelosia minhoensis LEGE 07310 TaxID=915328 RepID=A0A8J7ADE3_9CYAN|nr:XRE family transcriptional regulator [Romeria gracilis]MBE9077444.1 ImmA/IrrE family metallo-endopeptidase [Romeria aff. gracilis LEGE 07310]
MTHVNLIRHCREQSGLSQAELGDRVGVTRQTIAAWEREDREPSVAQLAKIAQTLGVSVELLLQTSRPATETFEPGLMFRADDPSALNPYLRATLSQKAADYAFVETLVQEVPTLPALRPLQGYNDYIVEEVAREIRDWLGVGEACPLGDVLALLESKGLKAILHPLPPEISGFSAYTETDGATIFINESHPTERKFFTALHELAHLVFHRQEYRISVEIKAHLRFNKSKRSDPSEKAANHFAGAVLLPEDVIRRELHAYRDRWLPEPLLMDIKRRYGVSLRTVLYRARQAKLITIKQKGQQIGILNKKYGADNEPVTLPQPEHLTRLERMVYLALRQGKITISRAAEILGKPLIKVRESLNAWLEEAEA